MIVDAVIDELQTIALTVDERRSFRFRVGIAIDGPSL